jgi:hypothetical protein
VRFEPVDPPTQGLTQSNTCGMRRARLPLAEGRSPGAGRAVALGLAYWYHSERLYVALGRAG